LWVKAFYLDLSLHRVVSADGIISDSFSLSSLSQGVIPLSAQLNHGALEANNFIAKPEFLGWILTARKSTRNISPRKARNILVLGYWIGEIRHDSGGSIVTA